jgi:hypothetical protein
MNLPSIFRYLKQLINFTDKQNRGRVNILFFEIKHKRKLIIVHYGKAYIFTLQCFSINHDYL